MNPDAFTWTDDARAIPPETVPADRAQVYWSYRDNRISSVLVLDTQAVWADPSLDRAHDCVGGAAEAGWLMPNRHQGEINVDMTPAGLFGSFCAEGFASANDLHRAIYQFARIEGQIWAQQMLAALAVFAARYSEDEAVSIFSTPELEP